MTDLDARLVSVANRIGDALMATAISDGARATWLGPAVESADPQAAAVQRTGDVTLYDGSAGIAIACSSVGAVLGRADLQDLAAMAARHAVSGCERAGGPGLYDGVCGIGLAALVVGTRSGDSSLREAGLGLLETVTGAEPAGCDLISGRAGIALALLRAGELTGDARWLDLAGHFGRELVERADRRPWGWSWPESGDDPGLCGLAHGAAGPAWVLQEIAAAGYPADRFDEAIAGAHQYERSWFNPVRSNWPDLRPATTPPDSPPPYPTYWCHGSVGIGLGRLAMHRARPHPGLAAEAAAALQSAWAEAVDELSAGRVDHGLTICHGTAGTIELLLEAHAVLGDAEHLETARALADQAITLLGPDVEVWPGGVRGSPGPGLMNGLAGSMHLITRLAAPAALPSLALLRF